jgi:hypothetical protein
VLVLRRHRPAGAGPGTARAPGGGEDSHPLPDPLLRLSAGRRILAKLVRRAWPAPARGCRARLALLTPGAPSRLHRGPVGLLPSQSSRDTGRRRALRSRSPARRSSAFGRQRAWPHHAQPREVGGGKGVGPRVAGIGLQARGRGLGWRMGGRERRAHANVALPPAAALRPLDRRAPPRALRNPARAPGRHGAPGLRRPAGGRLPLRIPGGKRRQARAGGGARAGGHLPARLAQPPP